jgi:hypothetical protein
MRHEVEDAKRRGEEAAMAGVGKKQLGGEEWRGEEASAVQPGVDVADVAEFL